MNAFIHKMFSSKLRMAFSLVIILVVIFGIYTIAEIVENAEKSGDYTTTFYYPQYPALNLQGKTAEQIALIKQGEYLVKAGDCIACHTDTTTKGVAFAGGLAMQTPFGVIYTPNITADKETGIGNWTDDEFIKAMHEGISPTGDYYYPAFPYIYFNQVTHEDLKAIKAYLHNIPAVKQANRDNEMIFPFNWRFLQLGWRMMFFNVNAGPYKSDPKQSAQWNRGAYLVEGLGHCAMCHTPSYNLGTQALSLGAPIQKYHLTGAVIQGYLAPNITKTNLGAIPNEQLIPVFTDARLIGGGQVQGPMLEAVHDSLSHLTMDDLLAMAVYLKTVVSEMPPQPKTGSSATGEYIYNSYCSGCHNTGVGGAPRLGDTANWGPLIRSGISKLYTVAINGGGNMPPKGTCLTCSNSEIKSAVDYMVNAATTGAVKTATTPKLTIAEGEQIYQRNCSSCHSSGNPNVPQLGDQKAWQPVVHRGFLSAYQNVATGKNGHPRRGNCKQCSDNDLLAAVKYMMQKAAPNKNYILW